MISLETIVKMAEAELKDDHSFSAKMEKINEIISANDLLLLKFTNAEIAFHKFLETVQSEREKDLLYIFKFFVECYTILHTDLLFLRKRSDKRTNELLSVMYETLKRYNLQHLLLEDLSEDKFFSLIKGK